MISVIITARREPGTIAKAIESIGDRKYSGLKDDFEIIQVSPDPETLDAGKNTYERLKSNNFDFIQIKDLDAGKPAALNQAFEKAKGDILILTDGDVYFEHDAASWLVGHFNDTEIGGVTGRPVALNSRKSMMGYYGNLLADAAHHKRTISLTSYPTGKSVRFISKNTFFPLSGYIMAVRNIGFKLPEDVLADDAYISYQIFNKGYKLAYEPHAKVWIKAPKTLSDYLIQKKRSLGGYVQLWKYGIVKASTKSRSFWHELQYFWFPLKYARGLQDLFWSLMFYPIRLYTWFMIWWERKILNKDFSKTWVRVESTK